MNEGLSRVLSLIGTPQGRAQVLRQLDRFDAEDSLLAFTRLMWPVLEPTRPLSEGRALNAIVEHLEAVTRGQIRKLLINVPPGFTKSMLTCVFWPAWEWIKVPSTRFVAASYAEPLSIRDNRRFRMLVSSPLYQELWGGKVKLAGDQNEKRKIENTGTGFKIATSVGGVATGERGDRFIVDDPHNVKETESEAKRDAALQWFTEVVPSRINDPGKSAFVVIMQRVHHKDVSGLILSSDMGYEHLCLPMEFEKDHPTPSRTSLHFQDWRTEEGELLDPVRFTADYLNTDLKPSLRAWGGTYAEAGQLQQRPVPRGGGLFKVDCLKIVPCAPARVAYTVRGWDLAASEDGKRTAGARLSKLEDGRYLIEHVATFRKGPHETRATLREIAMGDGPNIRQSLPQDPGQAGKTQKSDLAIHLDGAHLHFSLESGDKELRAQGFAAQVECGNVCMIEGPWNDLLLQELRLFPRGEFTDQTDALSRAYGLLLEMASKNTDEHVAPEVVDYTIVDSEDY